MSGSGNAVKKKTEEWLRLADDDLRLARHAFKLKSAAPYNLISYHAQQCAEKCFKAYLVFNKIDFPYTHDLAVLLELCPSSEDWTNDIRKAATILRTYAITTRYPGESKVTQKEALRAVALADMVWQTIIAALAKEGLKISIRLVK